MSVSLNNTSTDQIIRKLPMSVANQIAAGEVVERPSAALKEMMENAIDAGANEIQVILKDAGRTLIQVIDNGKGMSAQDARTSFERHTTSKIEHIEDLQKIHSFGFRGEALASIAAVSQIEAKTRREQDEWGVKLELLAGEIRMQEPEHCPVGTSIAVKNLFYNVPARRRFMKSDTVEFKHLHIEFQKLALCRPDITFVLWHNDEKIHQLPQTNLVTRISHLFGKRLDKALVPLDGVTDAVRISGFIANPDAAKKNPGEQFFFVNGRYFRSPYMQKAVTVAFAQLIPESYYPGFFIFLEVNTEKVDVNIHPTKSEVKFEEDHVIWQILNAAVREALGRFALIPSIDFDMAGAVEIPALSLEQRAIVEPQININPHYDPFDAPSSYRMPPSPSNNGSSRWSGILNAKTGFEDSEFETVSEPNEAPKNYSLYSNKSLEDVSNSVLLLRGKYIMAVMEDGVWVLDVHRVYYRILYERYLKLGQQSKLQYAISLIFPISWDVDAVERLALEQHAHDLEMFGFQFLVNEDRVQLKSIPGDWNLAGAEQEFKQILSSLMEEDQVHLDRKMFMARTLARASVRMKSTHWNESEIKTLVTQLLSCDAPDVCPEGKICFWKLTYNEIEKRLNL